MNHVLTFLLDLPPQASTFASGIDWLHAFVFTTAFVGSMTATLLAVFFIARFSEGTKPRRKRSGFASTGAELMTIGFVLSLFLLWWVLGFRQYDHMQHVPPGASVVHVTAKQWMWKFEHATGETELGTLTVPLGVPVELVMTSRDVIHSFYAPALRIKQDVVPGRYVVAWFEATQLGEFPIRCAELCGAGHAVMSGTLRVVPAEALERELSPSRPASPMARRGLEVAAAKGCLSCHSLDGEPRIGPSWLALAGATETMQDGERVLVDDAYLTESMMDPSARIVEGFANAMPSFRGDLAPDEAAAVIAFIHSLQGPP